MIGKVKWAAMYSDNPWKARKCIRIDTTQKILDQLYASILKTHISRIAYAKAASLTQSKSARKKLFKLSRGRTHQISTHTLSVLFGKSKSTAHNISNHLSRSGHIIKRVIQKSVVCFCTWKEWLNREMWWGKADPRLTSCYWRKGVVVFVPISRYADPTLADKNVPIK